MRNWIKAVAVVMAMFGAAAMIAVVGIIHPAWLIAAIGMVGIYGIVWFIKQGLDEGYF